MKKQTERGNIYNNDLRIRNKKYIEDNDINNNELLYKKLMKDIVNSSNSYKENISENKSGTGSNNNETIFTSNALKNTTNNNFIQFGLNICILVLIQIWIVNSGGKIARTKPLSQNDLLKCFGIASLTIPVHLISKIIKF